MSKPLEKPKQQNNDTAWYSVCTDKESIDTGMAMTLIGLLVYLFFLPSRSVIIISTVFLLAAMAAPILLKPLAYIWLKLTHLFGGFMSKVILTLIFALIIWPIGSLRRKFYNSTADGQPAQAKSDQESVEQESLFIVREHNFTEEDLNHPY